MNKRRNIWI